MPPKLPDDFPDLPSFDARDFEPPAWAKQKYQPEEPHSSNAEDGASSASFDDGQDKWSGPGSDKEAGVELEAPGTFRFTTAEMKVNIRLVSS